MAQSEYGFYDRVLDWFSDRRMAFAKSFVLLAVAAILGSLIFTILAQL